MPVQSLPLALPGAPEVLVVPGWRNSGPGHWQTRWEQRFGWTRLQQADWERPRRQDWVDRLDAAVAGGERPLLLVAHSLGCVTVAHWAATARAGHRVVAALLVAPADVERAAVAAPLRDFAPLPRQSMPFPTLLLGSDNDPACSARRAAGLAAAWGSAFQLLPGAGHINADSGLGEWDEGLRRLQDWLAGARVPPRHAA